jgi:L-lysine exporter family protein LysE/ArgO
MTGDTFYQTLIPFGHGFLLYISVIIALGPQNLFVLRQGLRRRFVFVTAFVSTFADVIITTLAVGGAGALLAGSDTFVFAMTLAGVAFLLGYGMRSLRSARLAAGSVAFEGMEGPASGFAAVLAAALAFALLNPGAYVDTFLVLGPTGWQFPLDQRVFFLMGAITAAGTWFFGLAYGARYLVGFLKRPNAAAIIDRVSGWLMIGMAFVLAHKHLI